MNAPPRDIVLIDQGRKGVPRLGRILRPGKRRVYVLLGRKQKRYAASSLTVLIRTRVRVEG